MFYISHKSVEKLFVNTVELSCFFTYSATIKIMFITSDRMRCCMRSMQILRIG